MLMNTGTKAIASKNNLLTTIAWQIDGKTEYALEGSVFIAGAVVQWLRDGLGIIESAEETEDLALSVPDTHGMTFIPAFSGMGSPYWRSDIRGVMLGLTRGVKRAHLVRAALESIAQQSADVIFAMKNASHVQIREVRSDGKAVLNQFLMQYQSDLIGLPVQAARHAEVTAWGVVRLAGEMIGFWKKNLNTARVLSYKKYQPRWTSAEREKARASWKKSMDFLLSAPVSS